MTSNLLFSVTVTGVFLLLVEGITQNLWPRSPGKHRGQGSRSGVRRQLLPFLLSVLSSLWDMWPGPGGRWGGFHCTQPRAGSWGGKGHRATCWTVTHKSTGRYSATWTQDSLCCSFPCYSKLLDLAIWKTASPREGPWALSQRACKSGGRGPRLAASPASGGPGSWLLNWQWRGNTFYREHVYFRKCNMVCTLMQREHWRKTMDCEHCT